MTSTTPDTPFGKSIKEFWHALLLIVPITFSWIWFLPWNVNLLYFTVAELEESFTGAGFQIVEKEIMGDNPVSCIIAAGKMN